MQRSDLSAAVLTRSNLRRQLIEMYPGIEEDEAALLDTLEGIDNFDEQVIATLRTAVEREATAEALGTLIDAMTARKRRMEAGAQSLRSGALEAMLSAGVPKIPAPDMTITIGQSKPKVIITNPDVIPEHLCRIQREPNKAEIAKALAAGDVPGAVLGNAGRFLSVRMS